MLVIDATVKQQKPRFMNYGRIVSMGHSRSQGRDKLD